MNIVSTSQFTIVDLNDSVFTPNLLPWSEDWVVGSGSLERWTAHGDAAENVRSIFVDPFGYKNVLWRCIPDADGGASGGFTIGGIRLKRDKTYRFTCFIKRSSTMGGTLTIGMGNVNSLAGIALSNAPVISFMTNVEPDTWYLLVGILHPAGTTSSIGKTGIYNMRGSKLIEGTEYAFGVTAEPTFYVKLDGATTAASEVQLFMPTLECLDGTEESIQTLIRYDGSENDYLRDVLEKGKTAIEGGLLTSNVILAAGLDGVVRSGMSGISEDNIGFFTGGTYDDAVNNKASNIIHKDGSVRLGAGAFAYDKASNRFNLGNFILLNDDIIGVDNGVERVRFSGGDVPSIDAIDQGWGYYAAGVYGNHPDSGAIPVELSPPSRKWVHANAAGYADSIMAFSISDEVFFTGSKQYRLDDVSIDAWIYNESADESTITATWGLYNVLTDVIVYPVGGPVSVSTPIPVTNSGRYKLKINVSPRIKISGVTPYQRCYFEAYFRCAGISQQGVHSRSLIGRDGIMSYYSANSYFYYKEAYGFEARFGGMGFRVSTSGIQKMVDGSTWVNDTLMNTSLASTTALGIMKVGAGLSAVEGLVSIATNGVTNAMLAGGITGSKLTTGYGDTTNPYGSKTAKHFLAAPNASTGVPSFRAIVASDIPTLNQNTTGQAGSLARAEGTSNSYRSVWFGQDPNHDKLSYDSTFVYNPALKTLQVGSTTVGRIMIGGGMLVWDNDNNALKVVSRDGTTTISLYATGSSAALGIGVGGGGAAYDRLDSWTGYDVDQAGWVLSAGLGHDTHTRVLALEASTPNVAWGVDGSGYTPLSVNGITRQLSTNGHTHDDRYYTETEIGNLFAGTTAITGYNKGNWDGVYTAFNAMQVGGRNLLIGSGVEVTNNSYLVKSFFVSPLSGGVLSNGFGYLVPGETYTVVVDWTPAPNVTMLHGFLSGGYYSVGTLPAVGTGRQKSSRTFVANYAEGKTPQDWPTHALYQLYRIPYDGTVTGNTIIHNIYLVKGTKALTDWTSAPEDVDASIATVQTNLTTHAGLTNNPHGVTKTQVGLGNVANVAALPLAGGTLTGGLIGTTANFTGNVGIGTTSPASKLHIQGSWASTRMDGDYVVIMKPSHVGGWARDLMIFKEYNGTDYLSFGAFGADDTFGYGYIGKSYNNTWMRFYPTSMNVVFDQGNVGIGKTDPQDALDVNGNIRTSSADGSYMQIGGGRLIWDNTNNAIKVIKSDGTAANFYATGSNSAVGIGTGGGGSSYNMVSDWSQYVAGSEQWVVSAQLINSLRTSVTSHIGDSTHASAGEKSNWNAAYSHSVVSGGVHMTSTDRNQLTTAYNHSQAAHAYQAPLTGTGFVKSTAGVISYDDSVYAISTHTHTYASTVKLGTVVYDAASNIISLPAYPTTLPASDVSSWAKAANKPSYTTSEVSEGTNYYFTASRVLGVSLTSITPSNTALASGITISTAMDRIQGQINARALIAGASTQDFATKNLTVAGTASVTGLLTASGNIATANADGAYMQVGPIKILYDATNNAIRVEGNIYATGSNTAFGVGGGAGGGGLITNVYGSSGFGGTYSDVDLSSTFNAYAINSLYTALQGKQNTITGAISTLVSSNLYANYALVSGATGKIQASGVTATELSYLSGVTSAVQYQIGSLQAQINAKPSINSYPTAFSWSAGSTSGPTATISGSNMTDISVAAIPAASGTASGIVTTGAQSFSGEKSFNSSVWLAGTNALVLDGASQSIYSHEQGGPVVTYNNDTAVTTNHWKNIFEGLLEVKTGNLLSADIAAQPGGTIQFANGATANEVPAIIGKSSSASTGTGLTLSAATANTNAIGDMTFGVRQNNNTDYTTLTSTAFKWVRYATSLMTLGRDGLFTLMPAANTFRGQGQVPGTHEFSVAGDNMAIYSTRRTTDGYGVMLTTMTINNNTAGSDMRFNVREQGNADYNASYLSKVAFRWDRYTTAIMSLTRGGKLTANEYAVSALAPAPASASAAGTTGEIRFTGVGIFICIATNTWRKATISTF